MRVSASRTASRATAGPLDAQKCLQIGRKNLKGDVVVVKLVIAESHIHIQGEVLSDKKDEMAMLCKEFDSLKIQSTSA